VQKAGGRKKAASARGHHKCQPSNGKAQEEYPKEEKRKARDWTGRRITRTQVDTKGKPIKIGPKKLHSESLSAITKLLQKQLNEKKERRRRYL